MAEHPCLFSFQAIKEVKLSERLTSPPDYLTEADLITLMEKHGIGTGEEFCLSCTRGLYYKIRFCILETQSWNWYPTRFEGQSLKKGSQ